MLNKAVDSYLAVRRAAGFDLKVPEYLLRSFARFASIRGQTHVSAQTVIEWASEAPSLSQRDHRLNTVRRFAHRVHVEDSRHEVPPKGVFAYRKKRRMPFILSNEHVNRLLQAATQLGPQDSLRPHTYSTLFALLVITGLRISEALALVFDDITADGLVIRNTKFQKNRLVPLHETAQAGLDSYLCRRRCFATCDDHIFITVRGKVLDRSSVQWTFRRILKAIGLDPARDGRRPRIHDLRHTYACRALEACPEGRDNVGRHMRALSTYMGHSKIDDTFWYLESTPHLMQDIAKTCESFLKGGRR
ncbi:tyrosine-type recombinase/integrase [Acidobacteriota bacterium]